MLLLSVVGIYADNPVTVKAGNPVVFNETSQALVVVDYLIRVSNPVVLICYEEVLKGAFRQCIYCSILLLNPNEYYKF